VRSGGDSACGAGLLAGRICAGLEMEAGVVSDCQRFAIQANWCLFSVRSFEAESAREFGEAFTQDGFDFVRATEAELQEPQHPKITPGS
jgi:hypothetical protein